MDKHTERRRFPHLLPKEVVLWNKFLDKHQDEYLYFEYDIHVGQGAEIPEDIDPMIRKIALGLTRKRIDVTAHKANSITLIEIKPDAGLSAMGQLLAYLYLYTVQFRPTKKVLTHIVSDVIDVDTRNAARAYGINWTTVLIDWDIYKYDRARRKFLLID